MQLKYQVDSLAIFNGKFLLVLHCLKSLFFAMTDQSTRQDMNYLSTQFQHCGLLQYRVVIGGLPLNADWVNVYNPSGQNMFSESLYALMEA